MAGARPSGFKKAGGFLNNVDGVWNDYEFTTERPGNKPQKTSSNDDFTPLYMRIIVLVDGADEAVSHSLFAGSADDFEITERGHTLVPVADDGGFREDSAAAKFIISLVEAGFPETNLPDDRINFEPALGSRLRFKQEIDEKAKAKGYKNKKGYTPTSPVVVKVYSVPKSGARVATTSTTGAKPVKTQKPNGKAPQESIADRADDVIQGILGLTDGYSIMKSKLPVRIAQTIPVEDPLREEIRRLAYSDGHLNSMQERGLITYDQSAKPQMLALVTEG